MHSYQKSVNVSYSINPVRKALAVPLLEDNFRFGSEMKDPIWAKAASADDFCTFVKNATPEKASSFSVFRGPQELVLGFFFKEPEELQKHPGLGEDPLWGGDRAELHFGSMGPDPWLLQLVISISGTRFDSSGRYDLWDYCIFENSTGWGAEIRLQMDMLRFLDGGLAFNICRDATKRNEHSVWSPLHKRYHEVEDFGELLMGTYEEIASLRMGKSFLQKMERSEFEAQRASWETPATQRVHGPYLTFPDMDSICISWETAGRVPAFVEYRRHGSQEDFRRAWCARKGGILASREIHSAQLTDLEPDTEYEYRLCTLLPVMDTPLPEERLRRFRTASSKGKPFSFLAFSDLHSNAKYLRELMQTPEAEQAAFHLSLGDNLSHAAGRDVLFDGVITPLAEANEHRSVEIPAVFVRGNHEQLGAFACEYFDVMGHPTGKTWYSFRHGDAFFIVLDSGDDRADSPERVLFSNSEMQQEERRFLEQTVLSKPYREARFRIVMVHMPPFAKRPGVLEMIRPLLEAEIAPDLMLCGHEHRYGRSNGTSPENDWMEELRPLPFPVLISACETALSCEIGTDTLTMRILEHTGDGSFKLRDSFSLQQG